MFGIEVFLYVIFISDAWILTLYTLNFYYLFYRSGHNSKHKRYRHTINQFIQTVLPKVTIQLPFYNEKYVALRAIDAVCNLDYPKDKMQIQILDDSDDDTGELIRAVVENYKDKGFDIVYLHRGKERPGYKAGALNGGMKYVKGDFVAIFDADFVPSTSFLRDTLIHFNDPRVGFVQCKWGHLNENYSSLTAAQAFSLDIHFLVEQKAKSMTNLFMNFNGTAGIWRTDCILDAGGWHTSTLVEDLDLSFRAQMRGWKCLLLEDTVVNGELPVQMNAAKRQQFRWAKGSTQVSLNLMIELLLRKSISLETKFQAVIQLTRHIVHPLFLMQFLIFPILLAMDSLHTVSWTTIVGVLIYVLIGPVAQLIIIRKIWGHKWKEKSKQYFYLILFASGISVNNTVAVFDALFDKRNEFLRTPKFGVINRADDWRHKSYTLPFTKTTLLESFFCIYGCIAIFLSIISRNAVFMPFIVLQTLGFVYVVYLGIVHSFNKDLHQDVQNKHVSSIVESTIHTSPRHLICDPYLSNFQNIVPHAGIGWNKSKKLSWSGISTLTMKFDRSRIILFSIVVLIVFGIGLAYIGYQNTIYPSEKALGYLSRSEASQTPQAMVKYLAIVTDLLPNSGNPVWIFPNPSTDFSLIHDELSEMISRANRISNLSMDSSGYNTGLQDLRMSIKIIEDNLAEITPYLYLSVSNILVTVAWIAAIFWMFVLVKRINNRNPKEFTTI